MPTMQSASESGAIFEEYRTEVYSWAYRLLGRHHDALDVTQDVCLRWIDQSRRDPPAHSRAWLRRVTTNRALDVIRSRKSARATADSDALRFVGVVKDNVGPDQPELRAALALALDALSEAQRTVLIAKVFDSRTFSQIAAELGLAIPTVKTHYVRALSGVRTRLAARWNPGRND